VTLLIILLNIVVFVAFQSTDANDRFTLAYSAVPREISTGQDVVGTFRIGSDAIRLYPSPSPVYLTLLSSMFMHGGWLHLGGNMLFLFIFGDNVEHAMGRILYLAFYLAVVVIAGLAQVFVQPDSIIPSLGASGAIAGVLGAYLVLFPSNRVLVLMFRFLVPVPAIVAIGIWAVIQIVSGASQLGGDAQGGVAYMAHIGGFAAGVAAGLLFRPFVRRGPPMARFAVR
jgi:membrane associated rhomboid family serine protease